MAVKRERILIVSENGLFSESIRNLLTHARPAASIRMIPCSEATVEAVEAFRPDVAVFVKDKGGEALDSHCLSLIKTLDTRVVLCTLEDNHITIIEPKHLTNAGVEGLIAAVWEDDG